MNTNLENNFSKLLETLKDCLQPKDQKPDNRPDCQQLLQKINEFSVDKNIMTKNRETYGKFLSILGIQSNGFLRMFFDYKINEQDQIQHNIEYESHEIDVRNTYSEGGSQMPVQQSDAITKVNGKTDDIRKLYEFEKNINLFFQILKVCLIYFTKLKLKFFCRMRNQWNLN